MGTWAKSEWLSQESSSVQEKLRMKVKNDYFKSTRA